MADILVHNAIKDVQQAINEGTTNIIYKPILGSELYDYVKAIIDELPVDYKYKISSFKLISL